MSFPCSMLANNGVRPIRMEAVETRFGWLGAAFTPRGLFRTVMMYPTGSEALEALRCSSSPTPSRSPGCSRLQAVDGRDVPWESAGGGFVERALELLRRYFAGEETDLLEIPLDSTGWSPFCARVYEYVRYIPSGKVETYGEIAHALGNPKAARAVGRAMSTNPVAPVVPCHRVVASDGKLCGFSASGGMDLKVKMLSMEGLQVEKYRVIGKTGEGNGKMSGRVGHKLCQV